MKVYLPYRGEFGGELLKIVPRINGDPSPKVVCHAIFKDCLYPSAEHYNVDLYETSEQIMDILGKDYEYIKPLGAKYQAKWFVPESVGCFFKTDVVIFPRKKKNMAAMNWDEWGSIVQMLKAEGINVFAAGHKDYSYHLDCHSAWDHLDSLGATIHAIKNSKVRIGLITALHVLSLMCGKNCIVLTSKAGNKSIRSNAGPNLSYLKFADHLNAGWQVWPLLENPKKIVKGIICNIK